MLPICLLLLRHGVVKISYTGFPPTSLPPPVESLLLNDIVRIVQRALAHVVRRQSQVII